MKTKCSFWVTNYLFTIFASHVYFVRHHLPTFFVSRYIITDDSGWLCGSTTHWYYYYISWVKLTINLFNNTKKMLSVRKYKDYNHNRIFIIYYISNYIFQKKIRMFLLHFHVFDSMLIKPLISRQYIENL